MMSDGDALRRAIVARPDDDTLRLVYADWLDENGRPERAGFVRAQVWAAQAEPFGPDARRHAAAAARVPKAQKDEWAKPVRQRVLEWRFARGFVEHVAVDVATFPRDAAALFAAEPIRSLKMTRFAYAGEVSLLPFFQTPELERVVRLDLAGLRVSPVELEPLAAECPQLANLTDLCLRGTLVMPDWLTTLLVGPALPALAGLELADVSHLGPRLADVLPRADHRHLLRLDVSGIPFDSGEIQKVLGSRCLREVDELRLGGMIGTGRAGALTHLDLGWVIPWDRLRVLDLNGQGVGDDGVIEVVKELARRREPSPLRWLGLANNRVGADGVRALVRSDGAKLNLYHLDVTGNGLTLSQRAALQARFPDAVIDGS